MLKLTYIDKNKWKKERLKSIAKKAIILVLLIFASNFIIEKTFHYNFLSNTMKAIVGLANEREDVPSIEIVSSGWETQEVGAWRVTKTSSWDEEANANIVLDVESISKISTIKKDVVLVLDNSYSMKGTKLDNLKSNTIDLVHNVLGYEGNKIAIINFNRNSDILSDFTTDERVLTDIIQKLEPVGTTNYNAALKNVDKLLETYQHEGDKDLIVLFLSDGYPCEDTPNQIATYQMLKEKYDLLVLNAVQYEMGDKIQPELIEVSDKQYLATEANLGSVLYKAIDSSDYYEEFVITDLINGEDFYIDSESDIKATLGTFQLVKEDGVQKVIWDLGENAYKTGTTERMTIHLSFIKKDTEYEELYSSEDYEEFISKSYVTNLSANVKSKFNGEEPEDITSNDSPKLPSTYYVFFDPGTSGHPLDGRHAEEHYVGEIITLDHFNVNNWWTPSGKYYDYGMPSNVTKINNNQFIMPNENVYVYGIWGNVSMTKSMDGSIFSVHEKDKYLYKAIKSKAFLSQKVEKYNGEGSNDFENDVYYYTGADYTTDEYVIFANYCWQIVRTTDTGGVKIVLYGEIGEEGTCYNEFRFYDSPLEDRYNYSYSLSGVGFMYDDKTDYVSFSTMDDAIGEYDLYSTVDFYPNNYYSKQIKYDEENYEYQLIDPILGSEIPDEEKVGYYTLCGGTSNTSCRYADKIVSIEESDFGYLYGRSIRMESGETFDEANTIRIGTGYEVQEDETYKLINEQKLKKDEYKEKYKSYEKTYACTSDECYRIYYIYESNESYFKYYNGGYYSRTLDKLYGNSYSYDNETGLYSLTDPKTFIELNGDLTSHHYILADSYNEECTEKCSQIGYIFGTGGARWQGYNDTTYELQYIVFENGKGLNDYIYDSLYNNVNVKDSNAKKVLENWFENNLLDYQDYLEDTIFCNDRTIYDLGSFNPNGGELNQALFFRNPVNPTLICKNKMDSFSISNEEAKLKYPIGLLTIDEALLANGSLKDEIALMTPHSINMYGNNYITPNIGITSYSRNWPNDDFPYISSGSPNGDLNIVPVISLKKGIKYTSGNGSSWEPYIIDMNEEGE